MHITFNNYNIISNNSNIMFDNHNIITASKYIRLYVKHIIKNQLLLCGR